jgi:hypothetical protein
MSTSVNQIKKEKKKKTRGQAQRAHPRVIAAAS